MYDISGLDSDVSVTSNKLTIDSFNSGSSKTMSFNYPNLGLP